MPVIWAQIGIIRFCIENQQQQQQHYRLPATTIKTTVLEIAPENNNS